MFESLATGGRRGRFTRCDLMAISLLVAVGNLAAEVTSVLGAMSGCCRRQPPSVRTDVSTTANDGDLAMRNSEKGVFDEGDRADLVVEEPRLVAHRCAAGRREVAGL